MSGFLAAIQGYFFFNDVLTIGEIVSLVVGTVGLAMVVLGGINHEDISEQEKENFLLGIALSILSAFLNSFLFTFTRKLRHIHYSVI
mmetsp:Transcript_7800/g.5849  ORF Transcript_7800/g.5849 Transcript_7800/m.5849 type:complete len:87 (+) Transcript_7800:401-661(+)